MKKIIAFLGSLLMISSSFAGFKMDIVNQIQVRTSDGKPLNAVIYFDIIAMTRSESMWPFYCLPWNGSIECTTNHEKSAHKESITGFGIQLITNQFGSVVTPLRKSSINPYEEGWFIQLRRISMLRIPICQGRSSIRASVCSGPFKEGGCGDDYEEYSNLPQYSFRLASIDGKVVRHLSLQDNHGTSTLQGTTITQKFSFNKGDDEVMWSASNSNLTGQVVKTNLTLGFSSQELEDAALEIEMQNGCN